MKISEIQKQIHAQNIKIGWWATPREDGTLLMLMVSELVEAMEGLRKGLMDDHLPHRAMAEVELADAMIRIMDFAESKGYDLESAIREKLAYNLVRSDHQLENRNKPGGKKF